MQKKVLVDPLLQVWPVISSCNSPRLMCLPGREGLLEGCWGALEGSLRAVGATLAVMGLF